MSSDSHADRLLSSLDPEQRQVAETLRGPVRVLAGAGTGKTRAITHRIAYGVATGVYAPTEVLAVTFTTRAAGEMRSRLRELGAGGVQARTFHAAALRQLRYFWPVVYGGELPQLIDSKIGLIAAAARNRRVHADQALLRDIAAEIEWAKVSNITPDSYPTYAPEAERDVAGLSSDEIARMFSAYEEVKRSQDRMDMEDVLLLTAAVLSEDERVAARVRTQYKWFVVDEFQDVSPLQKALLDLWLGGRNELCVVGDPTQTIYSFAGARADYLRDLPSAMPDTTSIELVRNYRSTPQLVEAANTLVAGTESQGVSLRAVRDQGTAVKYREASDEVDEMRSVVLDIKKLRSQDVQLSDVAVLLRINAQSEAIEQELADADIAYTIRGGTRFFERPEVRKAITVMRGTARAHEGSDEPMLDQVAAALSTVGWSEKAPAQRGQARDQWESWQALHDQAGDAAEANTDLSLTEFVNILDQRAADQHAPVTQGVTIATMHAAKGLEWPHVFVVGVHDKMVPITYASSPVAIEEERRLLYVAMTRARDSLTISWAAARSPGGRANRPASRFLAPLTDAGGAAVKRQAKRPKRVANCRECGKPLDTGRERKVGRCVDCPASYDEEAFERLRTWRLHRAQEESVPAFVIFTDATLQLLAEQKPTDFTGLLRINGIGLSKAERFGDDVLQILSGP